MSGAPKTPHHRRVVALLLLILATGTLFRVVGLSSGYQRVEDIPVASQIQRNYLGDWHPDPVLYYPNFFDYLVALVLRGASGICHVVGPQRGAGLYPFSLDQVLFAARLLSALLGSATILLVYAIGRRLFGERRALVAAFVFSTAFIHILFSHQIVLDVPMTFFYTLSLYGCVFIAQKRRRIDYALTGLCGGLAVATKYNAVFVFAAVFLAHWLTAPPAKTKFLRAFLDLKLYLAGAAGVVGFFLGHPYALLNFREFLGASRLLLRIVNETEWFLRPIQPKTLVDFVAYNKYFLAFKNILSAEGPVLVALLLLGAAAAFLRRNRRAAWLSLSGLAYFLGAVGFSRYRDLSMFCVFAAFFGMLGFDLVRRLRLKPRILRSAPVIVAAAALVALEAGALAKSYYLWDDDTTEMAERWIRRNIPETSFIGKEWFSPPLRGRDYIYPSVNRPYLFSSGFAPFSRFDYLITSSAAYGHFFRNARFYADYVVPYRTVRDQCLRVKVFFFWDIEYKNPELDIFRVHTAPRRGPRLELPPTLAPDNPAREFECVDGSPYGKSVKSFLLEGAEGVERTFISRRKIAALGVFVTGTEGEGTVEVRNSGQSRTIRVRGGETSFVILKPWLSFPFYKYIYRISIRGSGTLGSAWVRVADDDFDIGSELVKLGEWRTARASFLEVLKNGKTPSSDFGIDLELALCCRKLGLTAEAERFAAEAAASPYAARLRALLAASGDERTWRRRFEKFSGLDLDLFESLQSVRFGGAGFRPPEDEQEDQATTKGSRIRLASPEARLLPQRYRVELRFARPSGGVGSAPGLELAPVDAASISRPAEPVPQVGDSAPAGSSRLFTVDGRSAGERVRFVVSLSDDGRAAFEGLSFYLDVRDFFDRRADGVREALGVSGAGGR